MYIHKIKEKRKCSSSRELEEEHAKEVRDTEYDRKYWRGRVNDAQSWGSRLNSSASNSTKGPISQPSFLAIIIRIPTAERVPSRACVMGRSY